MVSAMKLVIICYSSVEKEPSSQEDSGDYLSVSPHILCALRISLNNFLYTMNIEN